MIKKGPTLVSGAGIFSQRKPTTYHDEPQPPAVMCESLRRRCVKLAVAPANNSAKKRRIILLWERGVITSGSAEHLISAYGLKHD